MTEVEGLVIPGLLYGLGFDKGLPEPDASFERLRMNGWGIVGPPLSLIERLSARGASDSGDKPCRTTS
jgi:hypothetical protein